MSWFKQKRIFLDYASATPILLEVRKVMEKYWSKDFYNPSAIYQEGMGLKKEIGDYRVRIAHVLGVAQDGIVFTSGGTESDNLALLGVYEKALGTIKKPHIIISAIEHPAIVATVEEIVRRGGESSVCQVDEQGLISLEALQTLLKPNTFLVSVGLANSEIGTIQPVSKIGRIVREFRKKNQSQYPYLHTDASQATSFLNINLESLQADMLTLDGSKIYGPKGVGILALRTGVPLRPQIFGGGQEGGRRAGTLSPALIAGFTLAFEIAQKDKEKESERLEILRQYFVDKVKTCLPQAFINGSEKHFLPNIVSVSIPDILSELILLKLDKEGVLVSVGSACSYDERISGSPVIRAIGKPNLAESTLRFSFGRMTTLNEIKKVAKIFCRACQIVVK